MPKKKNTTEDIMPQVDNKTTVDRIMNYFLHPDTVVLRDGDEAKLEQWKLVYQLSKKHMGDRPMVVGKVRVQFGVSRARAYSIVQEAEKFYMLSQSDTEFNLIMLRQSLIRTAELAQDIAQDYKSAVRALAEAAKIEVQLAALHKAPVQADRPATFIFNFTRHSGNGSKKNVMINADAVKRIAETDILELTNSDHDGKVSVAGMRKMLRELNTEDAGSDS